MPIEALPTGTVKAIGASQVLTDPPSIVKELLDNALDAKATAIYIEVSVNALDVIKIRDNGHGIAPEDRSLVCRRYCTSKIRDLSDLAGIGGTSLGFRGEALASAAELSGALLVTTRVDGEDVGVSLKVARSGKIDGRDCASHPIGTTVRVSSLFDHLPVRKQTALKVAAKNITKLRSLLQCYAFARPDVRLSLRVLKAKSDKGNWTYAPKQGAVPEDAAFKIVGAECAGQCDWQVAEADGYEIKAFVPRLDAQAPKISGHGAFVSVDGRPVATTRGVFKQIVANFRRSLKSTSDTFENLKDPFAWVMIKCPSGTYDANVEPAKDDLIFEDGDKVLMVMQMLLARCYPPITKHVVDREISQLDHPFQSKVPPLLDDLNQIPEVLQEPATKRQKRSHPLAVDKRQSQEPTNASPNIYVDARSGLTTQDASPSSMDAKALSRLERRPLPYNDQLLTPLHESRAEHIDSSPASQPNLTSAQLPPHPPWIMLSPRSSPMRQQRALRIDDEMSDLAPDDSVSVTHADDDIDPSLARHYHMTSKRRCDGRKTTYDPHMQNSETSENSVPFAEDDPEALSISVRNHPGRHGRRQQQAEDSSAVSVIGDEGSQSQFPSAHSRSYLARAGIATNTRNMDIRAAFAPIEPNAARVGSKATFKPFQPVVRRNQDVARSAPRTSPADEDQPHQPDARVQDQYTQKRVQAGPTGHDAEQLTSDPMFLPLEASRLMEQTQDLVEVLHTSIESVANMMSSLQSAYRRRHESIHALGPKAAGEETWGMPCPTEEDTADADYHMPSSLTQPPVTEADMTDWRDSILEYLAEQGELEHGMSEVMMARHLQEGIMLAMQELGAASRGSTAA